MSSASASSLGLTMLSAARDGAADVLLAERNSEGHWTGELSSSALATATAICALAVIVRSGSAERAGISQVIDAGVKWLQKHANPDGGWGDTVRSISNVSTTTLVWAALGVAAREPDAVESAVAGAEAWLRHRVGSLEPKRLAVAIAACYGKDRTFSVPILTMCAIAGRLGPGKMAWKHVGQLPFELAALPAAWFGAMRLPVVSYALPALIAIGQVRHHFRPTWNPVARIFRALARKRTLRVLERIQPVNGGFLEATPLTAFVTMSLAAMGLANHPVAQRGAEFLVRSARPDGSWAIDSNLATWLTTLAVNALAEEGDGRNAVGRAALSLDAQNRIRSWLLAQQYRVVHPYTNAAPGGWAWTDLPGGVPDTDDTSGALLALRCLGPVNSETRQAALSGVRWLMDIQNADGGIPTFCKGWGTLPFDRSSPDITAHALRAWMAWSNDLTMSGGIRGAMDGNPRKRLEIAIGRALRFLAATQRPDGSWVPLWFGHQHGSNDENPLYGSARVLLALAELERVPAWHDAARLAEDARSWLLRTQNPDGGWSGAQGAPSSVEETSLAIEALCAGESPQGKEVLVAAIQAGVQRLLAMLQEEHHEPSPIGFYFARLWYFERLYPLIFAAAALRVAARRLADFPGE